MPFFPKISHSGFFFLLCAFLYYSLIPLERFKAHYTDSTYVSYASVPPLKQKFSGWKWMSCICKLSYSSSFSCFKVRIKELMKKKYILEYVSSLSVIGRFYLHGNYQGKKMLYFHLPKGWGPTAFLCVCEREEKGLNFCNGSVIHLVFSLTVTKASLWRRVSHDRKSYLF